MSVSLQNCQPEAGDPGPKGDKGDTGVQGPKGDTGAQGAAGATGAAGAAGATGAQGPKGDTGAAGATGATGAQGPKGDPGTANVQYSPWISTTFTGSGTTYTASITATPITQDVLDKADIRIYWKLNNYIIPLPYSQTTGSDTYTIYQRLYVGRIELLASYSLSSGQFRYVIIPGAAPTGRKGAIDLNDYEAVKKAYNIPD